MTNPTLFQKLLLDAHNLVTLAELVDAMRFEYGHYNDFNGAPDLQQRAATMFEVNGVPYAVHRDYSGQASWQFRILRASDAYASIGEYNLFRDVSVAITADLSLSDRTEATAGNPAVVVLPRYHVPEIVDNILQAHGINAEVGVTKDFKGTAQITVTDTESWYKLKQIAELIRNHLPEPAAAPARA